MNAYTNENLRMPAHYTDMSEKEMEYDGSFGIFSAISIVSTIVGTACTAISHSGIIKDENINNYVKIAGYVCTGVGLFTLGCGLAAAAGSARALTIMGATEFGAAEGGGLISDIVGNTIGLSSYLA